MAKKESKGPSELRAEAKKLRNLFPQPMGDWKSCLEMAGVTKIKITGQSRITMCCPFHNETNPSAHIYLDRKLFRCYAGSCNAYFTDPIKLVQKLLNIPYRTAAEEFKTLFSRTDALKKDDITFFSEEAIRYKRMSLLADAFHEYLVSVWMRTDLPEATKKTVEYLKVTRKISDVSSIASLGLFPRAADLPDLMKGDKDDLDWAREFLSSYFYDQYKDNIVFIYSIAADEVTAFKLRHPVTKEVRTIKDDSSPMGFFGLTNPGYQSLYNNEKFQQSLVVEGEFDQISIFKNQITTGVFNEVVVAAGGWR